MNRAILFYGEPHKSQEDRGGPVQRTYPGREYKQIISRNLTDCYLRGHKTVIIKDYISIETTLLRLGMFE